MARHSADFSRTGSTSPGPSPATSLTPRRDSWQGVTGLIGTVRGIDIIRDVHDDAGSAVLYDAEMPGGTVRFAEFFTFGDGVINTLNVHYDGADYTAKGGR
jgi:hypothetical protein